MATKGKKKPNKPKRVVVKEKDKFQLRPRAKVAIQKIVENGGNVSKAMRDAGFSEAYAKNPQNFTKTKTFQDLVSERLSDELLTKTHNELMTASGIQHYVFPAEIKEKSIPNPNKAAGGKIKAKEPIGECLTDEEIKAIVESVPGCRLIYIKYDPFQRGKMAFYQAPDSKSRKDALDMAYKLRGKYAPEELTITKRKYQELSDEELVARRKAAKDKLLKKN